MSLANVAREHKIHPNLLSRWVKERTDASRQADLPVALPCPKFLPVHVESASSIKSVEPTSSEGRLEVNIDRGDLRIRFKLDPSQLGELGQILREVLR